MTHFAKNYPLVFKDTVLQKFFHPVAITVLIYCHNTENNGLLYIHGRETVALENKYYPSFY